MTPEQFAYWLQGFAEVSKTPPTKEQWKEITNHLNIVFVKVTPPSLTDTIWTLKNREAAIC